MITRFFHRREWALTAVAVVLIICQIFFDIRIPEYMRDITDAFLIQASDVVVEKGTEMLLCAFLSLGLALVTGFILANTAASVGRNMRLAQFDRIQSFSTQDINSFSAASLITRSTSDIYQIQNFIARGMQVIVKSPILAVWAAYMIYTAGQPGWTLTLVAGLIVIVTIMAVTLHFTTPLFKKIQWFTDGVNRSTREGLEGIRVIRAYNAEEFQEKRFSESNDMLLDNNLKTTAYMAPAFPIIQSMMNFVTLSIYWVGASIIASQSGTEVQLSLFSDMIIFTSYATMALSSIMQFFGIFRMLPRAMVGIKRVEEVVDFEPSITDGPLKESPAGHEGEVEFRNVSFAYPGSDTNVLEDISFSVPKGSTFAIIGSTGSGKTSLVNLITRNYEVTSGQVLVDGADVKEYELLALRRKLGYVSQNAIIFSGSVEYNVNFGEGLEDCTEEDIRRALKIAQAEEFVDNMPEGLDSHISQHGRNISGGQKQRISIARAVCRNPEIYILDDTFSALDFKTDKALREALKNETSGSTVIIVAQRIGTIMDADEIIVLDRGRIVGKGKHRDLLKDCEIYRDIARSQLTEEELQ